MYGLEVVDIAHAIQLAVTPAFLLSGIGVLLDVLTNRLARIVDRARLINVAITLSTAAALLVAMVVALLIASTFVPINLAGWVAVLFVLAMATLVCALLSFLLEVRVAIDALRIGAAGDAKENDPGLAARGRGADSGRREGTSPPGEPVLSASVQPRPLQHLDLAQLPAHVAGDDAGCFAQLAPAAAWRAVELDDAAILLQAARVRLVDEEVGVVLDRHGPGRYR